MDSLQHVQRHPTTITRRPEANKDLNGGPQGRQRIRPSATKEHKEKRITLDQLFTIIGQVESGNDDTATGDNGKSIGRYQIQKAYYTDALQYEPGLRKYKYHQMRNHKIAQRVMIAYFQRYAKKWTAEELCKLHNGGPKGPSKKATEPYWRKIQQLGGLS